MLQPERRQGGLRRCQGHRGWRVGGASARVDRAAEAVSGPGAPELLSGRWPRAGPKVQARRRRRRGGFGQTTKGPLGGFGWRCPQRRRLRRVPAGAALLTGGGEARPEAAGARRGCGVPEAGGSLEVGSGLVGGARRCFEGDEGGGSEPALGGRGRGRWSVACAAAELARRGPGGGRSRRGGEGTRRGPRVRTEPKAERSQGDFRARCSARGEGVAVAVRS